MTIGVFTFEIHLPGARSLKDKRQLARRVRERLRSRHNVAVAQLEEHAGLWQRESFAVVSVASGRDPLERLFEAVYREVTSLVPGEVIETGREYLEGADAGSADWDGSWE